MSKRIVGAVIGYGGMGNFHAEKMQSVYGIKLAGVYDIDPARNELARSRGIRAYASREELLADPSIDLVTIATPNDVHKEIAIAALKAGKNVICEKPVAMNSAELDEMIAASEKYGKLFTVHQNRRWDEDFRTIRKICESGDLGRVFRIESRVHGSRGIPEGWREEKEHGGGMILDWGVHLIDQMLGIVYDKKIEKVYCRCDHLTNDEVDDGFQLDLYFEDDLTARIEVGTSHFIQMPRFYMAGMEGAAMVNDWRENCRVVYCTDHTEKDVKPVVTAAGLTKTMAPRDGKTTNEHEIIRPDSDVHNFYRNFVATINGDATQIVTHPQLMRVMKIMEAAFASDAAGKPMEIEDKIV